MIQMKNTENLAGVTVSGEFSDFESLVDAFYEISIDEYAEKNAQYATASTRMLSVCYDLRHAFQGDREAFLVENYLTDDKKKRFSIQTTNKNLHYSCNILYPELIYCMLVLNELIKVRMYKLAKKDKYNVALHQNAIWDSTIAILRSFQAEFARCVKNSLSEGVYKRWLSVMNGDYIAIINMSTHYLNILENQYLKMNKEKRLKNISIISRKMAEYRYELDHTKVKAEVKIAMAEYGCEECELNLIEDDFDETEEFIW